MQRLLFILLLAGIIASLETVHANLCTGRQCFVDGLCNTTQYNTCGCKKGYRFSDGLNDTCVDIDECFHHIHDPCGHRGRCNNTVGDFICQCLDGWDNSPRCWNNVTDHPLCMPGYKGDHCQIAECEHGLPETKGIGEDYECICDEGWTRTMNRVSAPCDLDINECVETPGICQHGATCVNLNGSYACQCSVGWGGINCSQVNCTLRGCVHGVCVDGSCRCSSSWTGDNCSSLLTSVVSSSTKQPDSELLSLSALSEQKERDQYSIPFFVSIALATVLLCGLVTAVYFLLRFKKEARDDKTNGEDKTKNQRFKSQIHPADDV